MFNFGNPMKEINDILAINAKSRLTDTEFIENEIKQFLQSKRRRDMICGEKYFKGYHDILHRKRTAIGENGVLTEVKNLPNNRIIDNQYRKMVTQKVNYLLGQPIAVRAENEAYAKQLKSFFNKRFLRLIKNVGRDCLNCGIGWLFCYYNQDGKLDFRRFKPYEIIAGWQDEEHTILDYAIRIYEVLGYEGKNEVTIQKVEVYDENGIHRFIYDNGRLLPDDVPHEAYLTITGADGKETRYNWAKIPLIPFKYNSEEIPLICNIKTLQDGLNLIISNFQNNMEEDARNTVWVLVNCGGEGIGEFRRNLSTYGAIHIEGSDDRKADVHTLQVEINSENYKAILDLFKKAIIENAMGYDAKDDRLGGQPNQLNIQSMYSDVDLEANEMETEFQASFEQLLSFIDMHLANTGLGDFEAEEAEIIFNRDMLISESEIIDNLNKSVGILANETLVAQHPWVDDPAKETELKKREEKEALGDPYNGSFNPVFSDNKNLIVTNDD